MDGSTKMRLLDEGMRLFAERGYRATTVADIQEACGLTGGSGALYQHFRSKQALLEQGVRGFLAETSSSRSALVKALPDDPRRALAAILDAVWSAMADHTAVNRVILRDLDQFPDLLEEAWAGLLDALYVELGTWLEAQQALGRVRVADPQATAAVLLASLTYYRILDALIAKVPGDVDPEAFAAAWLDHAAATLSIPQPKEDP